MQTNRVKIKMKKRRRSKWVWVILRRTKTMRQAGRKKKERSFWIELKDQLGTSQTTNTWESLQSLQSFQVFHSMQSKKLNWFTPRQAPVSNRNRMPTSSKRLKCFRDKALTISSLGITQSSQILAITMDLTCPQQGWVTSRRGKSKLMKPSQNSRTS